MALYSWFNRKENSVDLSTELTQENQIASVNIKHSNTYKQVSVWPTTSVNSALSKGLPNTQVTYSSLNGYKLNRFNFLTVKNV